ncbi:polysaccharide deacetylase family protein [Candidatus Roizmanbacteria bacterium]|nr:polysaccharide deacetylase family protein [Candidatus Roizmanbacteria bacterium]
MSHSRVFLLIVAAIICALALQRVITRRLEPEHNPVVESPKTEMHKLPSEVERQATVSTSSATFRVPILMYHYVENITDKQDTIRQSLNVPPNVFDAQVSTLKNAGYTFMTAGELADVIDGKIKLPDKPVLLTFDDGHWDVDTVILPILKKYQAKATSYIITGFTGGSDFMTQSQIQEVISSGLVEIGAHTVHHISLKGQRATVVKKELADSKNALETLYHIPVVSFAYPNGSFDKQAVDAVHDAGYTNAVSTLPGIEANNTNRFYIPRIRPGRRTGASLLTLLENTTFKNR